MTRMAANDYAFYAFVAIRLIARRQLRGFSRAELAKRAGVNWTSIYDWERGIQRPRFVSISRVAIALNIPVLDFFPPVTLWMPARPGRACFSPGAEVSRKLPRRLQLRDDPPHQVREVTT